MGLKKLVLFLEIGRMTFLSFARPHKSVSEYSFLIKKITRRQKAKETKEEKRISVEILTGYDDIVCKIALCTFNLLDLVVNIVIRNGNGLSVSYDYVHMNLL